MMKWWMLAALLAFAPLKAESSDRAHFVLAYSHADFRSPESVKKLYRKIRRLARDNCPNYFKERNLAEVYACMDNVSDQLVQAVDHPVLTAYAGSEDGLIVAREVRDESSRS